MELLDLLKGKTMAVMTDMGVEVNLVIDHVSEEQHSVDLAPSTRENDWWPPSREWTTFVVHFTNGKHKEYNSISEIKFQ